MESVELQRLLIEEVSGVDDPANEIPGWMVQKAKAEPTEGDTTTFVTRLKSTLGMGTGKEVDVTPDELKTELDARDERLIKSVGDVVETVIKSVAPTPAAPEAPVVEATAPETLTLETVETALVAGIEKALEPLMAVLEGHDQALAAVIDRVANTEKAFGIAARTSLDGQEGGDSEPTPATKSKGSASVSSAITKALRNPGTPVYLAGTSGAGELGR